MPKHKFQPIFDYIDDKINGLKTDLREEFVTKNEFRELQTTTDKVLKELVDWRVENKTTHYRLGRAEGWIGQAATKINLPFET